MVGLVGAAVLATSLVDLGGAAVAATTATTQHLYSWGTFELGQSGSATPQIVTGVPGTIVRLSGSDRDMYALTAAGTVWAWGRQDDGALGNGTTGSGFIATPVQVKFPAGVTIASLPTLMPASTGMAIDTNGNVWGWGANAGGSLCNTILNGTLPAMITQPKLQGDVKLASGQNSHAIYYTTTGKLFACGNNASGQLGDGTFTSSINPVRVIGLPAEQITNLQTSMRNSGAVMADGSYWDWGYNAAGQLGDGSTAASDVPVHVSLPDPVAAVAQGGGQLDNGQSVAILSNSAVYTWGNDTWGQLGRGVHSDRQHVPKQVVLPAGVTFVAVGSGGASQYAIDSTGNVWAWGENNVGQLGIGNTVDQNTPVSVGVQACQVVSIAFDVAAFNNAACTP